MRWALQYSRYTKRWQTWYLYPYTRTFSSRTLVVTQHESHLKKNWVIWRWSCISGQRKYFVNLNSRGGTCPSTQNEAVTVICKASQAMWSFSLYLSEMPDAQLELRSRIDSIFKWFVLTLMRHFHNKKWYNFRRLLVCHTDAGYGLCLRQW